MARKLLLIFPPQAYPFMPYSAPYVLKGHVKKNSGHEVRCIDLNIEFFRLVWIESLLAGLPDVDRLSPIDLQKLEVLRQLGKSAYEKCRQQSTYAGLTEASAHWSVLQLGLELVEAYDYLQHGGEARIPAEGESWDRLLERRLGTVSAKFLDSVADSIDLDGVDVVGFSAAYMEQLAPALHLAKVLRLKERGIVTVMGGGALTHILETDHIGEGFFRYLDAAVPFEGEHSLLELLDALDAGRPVASLDNIATWNGVESTVYRKALDGRPRVAAVPDYSDLEHAFPTPNPVIPLLTSKGCYWGKCAYCVHHEGYGQGYFNFEESVFRDSVREAVRAGFSSFNFVDEAIPPKMVKRFAVLFKELASEFPGTRIQWMAEGRAEKSFNDPDFVDCLKVSGCRMLVSGIESGSQRVSDLMEKGIDLGSAAELARRCRENGIGVGWMFFVGFPGESEAEAAETFEYIRRNRDSLLFANVGVFDLERGSPLWKNPGKWNVVVLDAGNRNRVGFHYRNERDEVFTRARSKKLLASLLTEFSDLRPLMTTMPDRTAAFFLADKDIRELDTDFELRYTRPDGALVVYQPFRKRCRVLRRVDNVPLVANR